MRRIPAIIILFTILWTLVGCSALVPQYKKLIMKTADGSIRVFVGTSAQGYMHRCAYYCTKDKIGHYYYGEYSLIDITKDEYDSFKPSAEVGR